MIRMQRYKPFIIRVIPLLTIIFLVFSLFGKTLFPPEGKMIYGGDIYDAYFFWKNYLRESIRQGNLPFWNPYNFSGTPFLAHPNINIFYPPNWLFIILPLNLSFSWYFFIHLSLAGINMYWLARQFVKRSPALTSAIIYCLGGFFAARVYSGHLEYVDAASWVPLVFGLTRRALISPSYKNTAFSGIGIGILLLCGNELFFLFVLEMLFLYVIYLLFFEYRKKRLIIRALTFMKVGFSSLVIAFGLAALELLARYQFMAASIRSDGIPYSLAGGGSLPFSGLRLFVEPFFWGIPFSGEYSYVGPWPNLFEYTYYIGVVPIVLIGTFLIFFIINKVIKALYFSRSNSPSRSSLQDKPCGLRPTESRLRPAKSGHLEGVRSEFWLFLFLVIPIFLLISFGTYATFNTHEFLWRYVPFYKGIRFPARHLFVVAFALSIMTGMIADTFKNKRVIYLFIVLITANLLFLSKKFYRISDLPTITFDQKLISFLKKDTDLFRLLPDYSVVSSVRRDFDFGAASMYQIQTTSDYNSMILARYYHFIDLLNKSPSSSLLYFNVEIPPPDPYSSLVDFLNVKYVLSDKNFDLIGKKVSNKYKLLLEGERYKLYQNQNPLSRFFLVGDVRAYLDEKELEEAVKAQSVDFSKTVLLAENNFTDLSHFNLTCSEDTFGDVEVVEYSPNKIFLHVNASCNSFLSSSEVYYPGWKAKIDGKDTKVYLSNFAFRSIYVPKGDHRVEFYYDPYIYYIGSCITVITIIILILSFFIV